MSEEEKVEEATEATIPGEVSAVENGELADAESKTGIKDAGVNQDAVDAAKGSEEESTEEESVPSFFIEKDDRIRIEVDILFDKKTGELVSVSKKGLINKGDFEAIGFSSEWFDFTPADYESMSTYRQRCSVFRRDANRTLTDPIALRNYLVVWHLKDWSLRGKDAKKIDICFTKEGSLDDKSIQRVYKLNTTLLDVVLTLFEKEMMM